MNYEPDPVTEPRAYAHWLAATSRTGALEQLKAAELEAQFAAVRAKEQARKDWIGTKSRAASQREAAVAAADRTFTTVTEAADVAYDSAVKAAQRTADLTVKTAHDTYDRTVAAAGTAEDAAIARLDLIGK